MKRGEKRDNATTRTDLSTAIGLMRSAQRLLSEAEKRAERHEWLTTEDVAGEVGLALTRHIDSLSVELDYLVREAE